MHEIAKQWIDQGFQAKRILSILDLGRSTYYYQVMMGGNIQMKKRGRPFPGVSYTLDGTPVSDEEIKEFLCEFSEDDLIGGLGYRKWCILLRTEMKLVINAKKVYRLCKELGVLKIRSQTNRPKRQLARNRSVTAVNQLWQMDIKYVPLKEAGFFLMTCNVIDVYDRQIVGYYCGRTCRSEDVIRTVMKAILRRKVHLKPGSGEQKLIIRTDNGPQFISHSFAKYCAFHGLFHERIPNASPNLNAFIESYHSQLQRECIVRHEVEMETFDHAIYYINDYVKFYNERRPHGSLGNLSPKKFFETVKNDCIAFSINL